MSRSRVAPEAGPRDFAVSSGRPACPSGLSIWTTVLVRVGRMDLKRSLEHRRSGCGGHGPDQVLRALARARRRRSGDSRAAASTACSARTAPARPRRSASSPPCCGPTAARARVLGHDVVARRGRGASKGEPHGAVRVGRRGPHRVREPRAARPAARPLPTRGARSARARAARRVRPRRRRRAAGRCSSRAGCAGGSTSRRASS